MPATVLTMAIAPTIGVPVAALNICPVILPGLAVKVKSVPVAT
ncbi:hypothetical protein ABEW81_26795 [Priestia megaterium]